MSKRLLALALLLVICAPAPAQTLDEARELNERVVELYSAGRLEEATKIAKRAVGIYRRILGPTHLDTAINEGNLAELYRAQGELQKALALHEKAIVVLERSLKEDDPALGQSLGNMALLYESMGDLERAAGYQERALRLLEKALGEDHPGTVMGIVNLARIYQELGRHAEALSLSQRSLDLHNKHLGNHPDTARSFFTLADIYYDVGDYEKAFPLLERALAIQKDTLGPAHPETLTSLDNLGVLYLEITDYEKAFEFLEEAYRLRAASLGPADPDTMTSLNNLAGLCVKTGRPELALPLYQRALSTKLENSSKDDPSLAISLTNLGSVLERLGNYQEALPLYQRAVQISRSTNGEVHRDTAVSLNNLAGLYRKMGRHTEALPLCEAALAIERETLGPDHPYIATTLANLAVLHIDLDSWSEVTQLAEEASQARLSAAKNLFSFASERQRWAYHQSLRPYDLFGTIGTADNLLKEALRYKGLVLDSMVEDQRFAEANGDPATQKLVSELKATKSLIHRLRFEEAKNQAKESRELRERELRELLENTERKLARAGIDTVRTAFSITPEQVQERLSPGTVLVEYINYSQYIGGDEWENRYGAVILPATGKPVWVPLPEDSERLDNLILEYKKLVRQLSSSGRFSLASPTELQEQGKVLEILRRLYDATWAPLDNHLPADTETLILSPDGELNFVSMATLLAPDESFLAEKYYLTYVASGRDLLAVTKPTETLGCLLVGDPLFLLPTSPSESSDNADDRTDHYWSQLRFDSLPYTRNECEALKDHFQRQNSEVETILGNAATETAVRQVEAPEVLHLATHGYFLSTTEAGGSQFRDPMFRSGLALAGAQNTVEARAQGHHPDMKEDGLLTAAEVGVLNLRGTKLVALSACDTGTGEARVGEGVLGLRRGFVQAGATNLVLTLWPVADKETAELMADFYAETKSQAAPLALAAVQRDWLVRLRKERSLAEAVRLAGPFVLSFQGRIERERSGASSSNK